MKQTKINRSIVAKRIREAAVTTTGNHGRGIQMDVSPAFVDEYIGWMLDNIDTIIPKIADRVQESGRKTLMVRYDEKKREYIYNDVVAFFSRRHFEK